MNKEMKYLSLKEIQYEEKEMLKQVISFLDENNIKYYIWAGSFLGTVRHKGFIPWDDDIDLAIARPDYERMIELLKKNGKELSENLKALGFELDNFYCPFIKIVNKKIKVDNDAKSDYYLWIDIFPLDGAPEKNGLYYKKFSLLKRLYHYKREDIKKIPNYNPSSIKSFFKKTIKIFLRLFNWNKYIENFILFGKKYSYKESKYVCNNAWGIGEKEKFPKELLNETAKYQFEDVEVTGIKDYDKWLSIRYGDYMKLPPEKERITHSFKAWRVKDNDKEA